VGNSGVARPGHENIAMTDISFAALIQGMLMGAGLIAAIGAQNALVLRQGLLRQHVTAVVALCTLSDWLLIGLGVFGLGSWIQSSPGLLIFFRWGGALYLLVYGAQAARRAWFGSDHSLRVGAQADRLSSVLIHTLTMTYLNPHVYLDTVVLLGSVGAQYGEMRPAFTLGAGLASLLWFALLGYGAAAASRWLARPVVWRAIDASVALVMWAVAAQLVLKPAEL
jgi:L-lysine exporter family protein LysE/ArgO